MENVLAHNPKNALQLHCSCLHEQKRPLPAPGTLPKSPTGITGLDEITGGGRLRGRPRLLCGSAGCGKTMLALEFLVRGATQFGEPGVFMTYVSGSTPHATRAIVNIRKICEEHLQGRYKLEIVDIAQNPTLAEGEQIIAAPTLIKKLPLRRFIGEAFQTEKILLGPDLRETGNKRE